MSREPLQRATAGRVPLFHCSSCLTPFRRAGEAWRCPSCETAGRWGNDETNDRAYGYNRAYFEWLAHVEGKDRAVPIRRGELYQTADGSITEWSPAQARADLCHSGHDFAPAISAEMAARLGMGSG